MNVIVTLPYETVPRIGRPERFDAASIVLHWLSVVLIVALFATAWSLGLVRDGVSARALLTVHRSLGATLWIVVSTRLAWRRLFAARPDLPRDMPRLQKTAAATSEAALYVLMLLQPLTGFAQSVARGKPFALFVFETPKLMARDNALAGLFHTIHEVCAWLLLAVIGLHVSAALFHALVRRDGVLASMWPWPIRRP